MSQLEDKLRAALRDTAGEIPPYAPPLRLDPRRRAWLAWFARGPWRPWRPWIVPLGSAVLVVALIAASLAVAAGLRHPPSASSPTGLSGVPPYYVAIMSGTGKPGSDGYESAAEVRATATGAVLARIVPPKPYVDFTSVTGAADDRTFVLSAEETNHSPASPQQEAREYPNGYTPAARFFLLHIDPASPTRGGRVSMRALPTGFIPAKDGVRAMALSPDGALLAADIGGDDRGVRLFVYNLATGTERAWTGDITLTYGGINEDALSWTSGGQVAFIGSGGSGQGPPAVRLLDVSAPGQNLENDSRPVAVWRSGLHDGGSYWLGAIVAPDGRTAMIIEELLTKHNGSIVSEREQLAEFSTVTGRATAILNNLAFAGSYQEQVMYTNATGSVLAVSYARPGMTAGILHGSRYTPIPWSGTIFTAAW
jgi:hypothetical protein